MRKWPEKSGACRTEGGALHRIAWWMLFNN